MGCARVKYWLVKFGERTPPNTTVNPKVARITAASILILAAEFALR
jgi:hypothetical protein